MALIREIWNCRTDAFSAEEPTAGAERYQWQYRVRISRIHAEHVREVLWKAAKRCADQVNGASNTGAAAVTWELAEYWNSICEQL
jgi:hypothetical protein